MFNLNTRDMEYVLGVVNAGTLSKASRKLHTTQPNLSRVIFKEEEKLGLPLFNKDKIPWTLTYIGELYIKTAKEMLETKDRLAVQVESIISEKEGLIKLGLMGFEERYLMPRLMPLIKEKCKNLSVETIISKPLDIEKYYIMALWILR